MNFIRTPSFVNITDIHKQGRVKLEVRHKPPN